MSVYYNQQTNEKVEAKKVTKPHESFGNVLVSEGNFAVTRPDGNVIGVAAEDFALYYAKTKNKDLPDTPKM